MFILFRKVYLESISQPRTLPINYNGGKEVLKLPPNVTTLGSFNASANSQINFLRLWCVYKFWKPNSGRRNFWQTAKKKQFPLPAVTSSMKNGSWIELMWLISSSIVYSIVLSVYEKECNLRNIIKIHNQMGQKWLKKVNHSYISLIIHDPEFIFFPVSWASS